MEETTVVFERLDCVTPYLLFITIYKKYDTLQYYYLLFVICDQPFCFDENYSESSSESESRLEESEASRARKMRLRSLY